MLKYYSLPWSGDKSSNVCENNVFVYLYYDHIRRFNGLRISQINISYIVTGQAISQIVLWDISPTLTLWKTKTLINPYCENKKFFFSVVKESVATFNDVFCQLFSPLLESLSLKNDIIR